MIDRRVDFSQSGKLWIVLAGFAVILYVLWQLSAAIAAGSTHMALFLIAGFVAFSVAGRIAGDWRSGVSLFFVWLILEDLVRKYMGNNMYIYFAKDVLLAVTYVSVVASGRQRHFRFFRAQFQYALGVFFILGLAQVFNPFSPSLFYGVLGLKLYFFYVPLMFVGYSMLRDVEDLRRFLLLSMFVAIPISVVGILQTILGLNFLNPRGAEDIDLLSHLTRQTPSGLAVIRPPSVFVSDGRFGAYVIVLFILGLGTAGFLLLRRGRGRSIVFPALGVLALAAALTGSRGAFLYAAGSAVVLPVGMLWGAGPRVGESYRLVKAIRRSFVFVAVAVALAVSIFPDVIGAHLAYYRETLMPNSENFEGGHRTWDYPLAELKTTLSDPKWATGYGIGTRSLGGQYVSRIMEVPATGMGVENGYGNLIQELGILGPILWLTWSISLFAGVCRVALKLRGTWAFPVGLSIAWFAFIVLFPFTWGGLVQYENFITNAYFWLSIGFLFRLPGLVAEEQAGKSHST